MLWFQLYLRRIEYLENPVTIGVIAVLSKPTRCCANVYGSETIAAKFKDCEPIENTIFISGHPDSNMLVMRQDLDLA